MWFIVPIAALLVLAASGGRASAGPSRAARPRPATALAKQLAVKWAGVFGVPVSYVLTIIERESGFNPNSTNMNERAQPKGGAWGLMQETYDTAVDDKKHLLRSQFASNPQVRETLAKWDGLPDHLLDPDINVMFGTFHLSTLVREFKTMQNVAAAYHQGAATVRRLLAQDGDLRNIKPLGRVYVANAMDIYRKYA